MKSLPVGQQSFADLRSDNNYYVDKTPFIKAVMEHEAQVLFLTRPRRFGKTLFMDTLQCFLRIAPANPGKSDANARLFAGLKILEDKPFCDAWMGQHPVIGLSLKDVLGGSFELAYKKFANLLCALADQHAFLLESPKLTQRQKTLLARYRDPDYLRNPSNQDMAETFLKELSTMVAAHYGRKVILLIDEYDVPLAKAAARGYYSQMADVIRNFLSEALKTSPTTDAFLLKAVLTGCLRVSKESIFTGLNNPGINTVCSEDYTLSEAIGFTEAEVKALLDYYQLGACFEKVKTWYDGYRFHRSDIYCPWDVINFCSEALHFEAPTQYAPRNYWANSSSNDVIAEFLGFLSGEDTDKMQTLVDGGSIDITVNEKLNYGELARHHPADFWTLLFFTGYLTIAERLPDNPLAFRVRLPNEEIRKTFRDTVAAHFSQNNETIAQNGQKLAKAAFAGDASAMRKVLVQVLEGFVSVRDAASRAKPENFYQGFLAGLFSCAGNAVRNFESNGEAGDGYADFLFTSFDGDTGVVIEIKQCRRKEGMKETALDALKQVQTRRYAQGLDSYDCSQRFAYGIAFCGKFCIVQGLQL